MKAKVQGIIAARGGSKGVPRKNLLKFGNRTLLQSCIDKLKPVCDRVVVSTEDDEIAFHCAEAGADIRRRPPHLAEDHVVTWPVLRDTLEHFPCERVVFAQCTAPMMTYADVRNCLEGSIGYDLAVCCVPFHGVVIEDSKLLTMDPANLVPRQKQQQWIVAGSVWACSASYIIEADCYTGRINCVPSSYPRRVEIDSRDDLELARLLWLHTNGGTIPPWQMNPTSDHVLAGPI